MTAALDAVTISVSTAHGCSNKMAMLHGASLITARIPRSQLRSLVQLHWPVDE